MCISLQLRLGNMSKAGYILLLSNAILLLEREVHYLLLGISFETIQHSVPYGNFEVAATLLQACKFVTRLSLGCGILCKMFTTLQVCDSLV